MGREAELAGIAELLDRARSGSSGVLVLAGDAGMGKTTLLEGAVREAAGFKVLWTRGVESEMTLSHAGLLQLLNPVRDLFGDIPPGQATALGAALGWTAARVLPGPLLVAAGTLSLLSAAAARDPLLVLVDDAHWLDHASAAALLFSVRRMRDDPVAFLVATRPEGGRGSRGLSDLPVLELAGLDPESVRALWPRLAPGVCQTLVVETGGNPLVLSEMVPRLTVAQTAGAAPLPSDLPVGSRLLGLFEDRLDGLSPAASRLALLHACAGGNETAVVATAARAEGLPLEDATDELLQARVLGRTEVAMRLAHPLLRSAVLAPADAAELRRAHASLADAADTVAGSMAGVWHRAAATDGPDDELARALVRLAETARQGAGSAAASLALERAASLARSASAGMTWLAAAASDAFLAGDLDRARSLAYRILMDAPPPQARAEALFVLGMIEEYAGSVVEAATLLAEAATLAAGVLAVRVLTELAMTQFRLGDAPGVVACAQQIQRAADLDDPYQRMFVRFLRGWASFVTGDTAGAQPDLEEALALVSARRVTDSQTLLVYQAAAVAGDIASAVAEGASRTEEIRRAGLTGLLVSWLALVAGGRSWIGDHTGAYADAGEAAELAEHLGYVADAASAHEALAWQSAARGLHNEAAASLAVAARLLDRAGLSSAAAHHALNAAFCALCRDDAETVVSILLPRLDIDGGVGAMGEPLGIAPLLVEALVALGRDTEARALATDTVEATPADASPRLVAAAARCRSLTLTDPAEAREAFEASLASYEDAHDLFEAARTRLLLGAWLRRRGERTTAREQLQAAETAFVQMELTAWTAKARAEMEASGLRARSRRKALLEEPLTSQETRVALLVAQGLSNKEVAAHLFLSPRTVETHLTAIFRKRGFRTRTQLALAFRGDDAPTT